MVSGDVGKPSNIEERFRDSINKIYRAEQGEEKQYQTDHRAVKNCRRKLLHSLIEHQETFRETSIGAASFKLRLVLLEKPVQPTTRCNS